MLTAAVLYTKEHPGNPRYEEETLPDLALNLGDFAAQQSERDEAQDRRDYEREIHFWLDSYRLLRYRVKHFRVRANRR